MSRVHPQARAYGYATIILVLAVVSAFSWHLWNLTQRGHETVLVRFDGSGELIGALQPDDPVLVRGVNVGQVETITPVPGGVRVLLRFWSRQPLYQDALAVNTSHSLMGQRVVDLAPGRDTAHPLAADGSLPGYFDPGIAEVMSQIFKVLDAVITLRKTTETLVQGGNGNAALSRKIMGVLDAVDHTLTGLESLSRTIDRSAPQLGRISKETRKLSGSVPGLQKDLAGVLADADSALTTVHHAIRTVQPMLDSTTRLVGVAMDTAGPLRPVLHDDSLIVAAQRLEGRLNTLMTVLEGQIPMKFRIHLLGSNPSKRGE